MAVDPKNQAEPTINVYVSQLCEELRALKNRVNLLEGRGVRSPEGEVLSELPVASARALKTLSFDALGNVVADAPIAGDYSAYAVELTNRLKRDGTQAMLAELPLAGNAVTALGAVPKQQLDALGVTVEDLRGTDSRIAELPETSYYDSAYSSMQVKLEDGRIAGWGRGTAGNLGTGNTDDASVRPAFAQYSPRIPDGVSIVGFTLASADSFVWLSNGWVYHAGNNSRGIGGHGDTTRRTVFTRIAYFHTNGLSVVNVKPRCYRTDDQYSCSLFLCSNGDVYFTGYTAEGDAGDGVALGARNVTTPVKCLTVASAESVSLGSDNHSGNFAWKADGTCYAWGANYQGMLGNGTTASVATPVVVAGIAVAKVVNRVSMNASNQKYGFTLFLLQDGTVKASGYNGSGQLGDGTTVSKSSPVTVGTLSSVADIGAAGGDVGWGWAVTTAKELWQWGSNTHGGLGIGSTIDQTAPVQPIGWIDESDVAVTTGAPPFQGKIVKVVTGKTVAGGPIGRQQVIVLDEDGNVWNAGFNDTMVVGANAAGTTTRFKRASLGAVYPGDKIVDIHLQGHSSVGSFTRLFAITQQGRLLMSGLNNYDLATMLPGTSSNPYRPVFLQPIRLGL